MGWCSHFAIALISIALMVFIPNMVEDPLPKRADLWAAPRWRRVADAFRHLLDIGKLRGGSFAVYHKGEKVVDFIGGYADPEALIPWSENTLCQVYSATKGVSAIVIAILVDRGLLEYEKPVKYYWPEFAVNGKGKITIDQLFSHQAGLAVIDEEYTLDDVLNNPEKIGRIHASQKPYWTPGTAIGYHSVSLGFYMDQIVRRVDPQHRSLSQFFREEVAEVLDLDFMIGLPKEENWRCARVHTFSTLSVIRDLILTPEIYPFVKNWLSPDSMLWRSMTSLVHFRNSSLNDPYVRQAPMPASNGFGTADSLAKLFGILANGGTFKGKKLLSTETISKLNEPLFSGVDLVIGLNVTLGRGMMLFPSLNGLSTSIGTPGAGGQMAYGDLKHKLGWAYLTNFHDIKLVSDNYNALWKAMYETVYEIEKS